MSSGVQPILLVVVDTEEEFDWNAPFSRASTGVSAMAHVGRAHTVFGKYGIKPTYVVDYPVAAQHDGAKPLQELFASGACAIGAHLHPWVNPPFAEPVGAYESFTCNLEPDLQAAKVASLVDVIADRFDHRPRVFKAGRYGLGSSTVGVLEEHGFFVDNSVCPAMDFSDVGGPNFMSFDAQPFFITPTMLECPCTVGFVGWLGRKGPMVHQVASSTVLERVRSVGILSRMRAVRRIMLSPEGNTLDEMIALARDLYRRGLRVFTLTYHSPSLEPGHTPYVRTEQDLGRFLGCLDGFCEFFMTELHGRTLTAEQFRSEIFSESTS